MYESFKTIIKDAIKIVTEHKILPVYILTFLLAGEFADVLFNVRKYIKEIGNAVFSESSMERIKSIVADCSSVAMYFLLALMIILLCTCVLGIIVYVFGKYLKKDEFGGGWITKARVLASNCFIELSEISVWLFITVIFYYEFHVNSNDNLYTIADKSTLITIGLIVMLLFVLEAFVSTYIVIPCNKYMYKMHELEKRLDDNVLTQKQLNEFAKQGAYENHNKVVRNRSQYKTNNDRLDCRKRDVSSYSNNEI